MIREALNTVRLLRSSLKASQRPLSELERRQESLLRQLIQHAYDRVDVYRNLYDAHGFHPEHFRSLETLADVPILKKSILKATPDRSLVDRHVDLERCQILQTSGSTGMPLSVYLGEFEAAWQRAVTWRILFENGYRLSERTFEIRARTRAPFAIQRLGIGRKTWLSLLESPERWAAALFEQRYEVIMAGAETLNALAVTVAEMGIPAPAPRILYSDSESLTPEARETIRHGIGTDPIDVYGLVEVADFAWQCEERQGYHISADSHVVEVLAPPGEPGPIVVSGLGMWTMPMIRYDTGDIGVWDSSPCPCGRTLPLLSQIRGRTIESLWLPDGRRLHWPLFYETLSEFQEIERWQIIQGDQGEILLQFTTSQASERLIDRLRQQLRLIVPEPADLRLEHVHALRSTSNGNSRLIRSSDAPAEP